MERFFHLTPFNFCLRKSQKSEIEIFTRNTRLQNTTIGGDAINLVKGLLHALLTSFIL